MANLSASELRKYDWRSEVFIKKLQEKTPFEVSGGKKVILKSSQNDIKILKSGSNSELSSLRFMGDNGQQYKLSDIVKNVEFGGKGDRAGTVKEDRALESLRQQIMEAKKLEKSATINIRIAGKIYKVYDAESTPGTPKSDFHLIDQDGKEIVWISHKDGKTEKDFQQWGGMSERVEPTINRHPESQNFIKTLLQLYPKGIPNATTVARKIKDKKLKMMSVYGNGFSGSFGRQNVTITIQGDIKLVKSGNAYKIEGYHTHPNGEDMSNGYEPVFMAVYKGDRSDFGVKGARIVIAPLGSRKIKEFV